MTTSRGPSPEHSGGWAGKLGKAEAARLSGKNPNSFTAYDYVMKGWYELYKFTREDNAAARDLFELARKIDPNYARAYAGLAWTYADWITTTSGRMMTTKLLNSHSRWPARRCALIPMIIKLTGHLGGHIYTTGNTRGRWRITCALENSIRTTRRFSLKWANFLIYIGQPKQAVDQVKEAIRLNPYPRELVC